MECKRRFNVHWGVLLMVYLAILFATTMVVLITGTADAYYTLLLLAGVPVYFVASKAVICDEAAITAPNERGDLPESNVVPFPDRPAKLPADITQLRKLG